MKNPPTEKEFKLIVKRLRDSKRLSLKRSAEARLYEHQLKSKGKAEAYDACLRLLGVQNSEARN